MKKQTSSTRYHETSTSDAESGFHDIRIALLRIEGTNCEQEIFDVCTRLHTKPEFVHLKEFEKKGSKKSLADYQFLVLPGGFSAGDYVRAGAIFAARMKTTMMNQLEKFIHDGKPVLGICNGFQILVELGLLPDTSIVQSAEPIVHTPKSTLTTNDSFRFECRHVYLSHENKRKCIFTKSLKHKQRVIMPCAHAEGKLIFSRKNSQKILKELIANDEIVFRYVDRDGNYASYPWNPNGSIYNIAGLCNSTGTVLGLMPHPERVFYRCQHHHWSKKPVLSEQFGNGASIFSDALKYIKTKF